MYPFICIHSHYRWATVRNVQLLNHGALELSSTSTQPDCAAVPITSRELSTVCLSGITYVNYSLITASSSSCSSNVNEAFSAASFPQLQYRQQNSEWVTLEPRKKFVQYYNYVIQ